MLKLLFLPLLTLFVTVSGSYNHHSPLLARSLTGPKVVENLVARQDCSPGYVPCGPSGCMPSGAVCCDDGFCLAGQFCWVGGRFCCLPGYVECGVGCVPPDAACCNAEGEYCDPGEYCVPGGYCCPIGQTCEGGSTTYLAGATLTGPTGLMPTQNATMTPSAIPPTTSIAYTATTLVPTTITTPSVATYTGGAAVVAGPAAPDVFAALAFAAGQILL